MGAPPVGQRVCGGGGGGQLGSNVKKPIVEKERIWRPVVARRSDFSIYLPWSTHECGSFKDNVVRISHLCKDLHMYRRCWHGGVSSGSRDPPPPLQRLFWGFFACQYMKIPTDLDPNPPLRRILAQNPPFKEFLDPPLGVTYFLT